MKKAFILAIAVVAVSVLGGCNKKAQPQAAAMPSQNFVGKWGDGNDFIKINSISNDAIDFEWSVPNRGIETTGTAKIEGNRIVFVTNGGDFSGTMAFDGNGISLTVEKTGWPKIDAGAKWVYANKNEQGTKSGGDISLPPVINLYQYSEEKYDTYEKNFRIWGWSKNGRVAYTYDVFEGGTKGTYALIFDFVQDKKIWSKSSEWNDWNGTGDDEGLPPDEVFYQAFINACIENGIELVQAEYRKLPIVHNNKTYNVIFDINLGPKMEYSGVKFIDNYKIMVETQGKRKIIHSAQGNTSFNVFPYGYFISPFENRALLVYGSQRPGGYNPTSFVGCDLDRGFTDVDAEVVSLSFDPFVDVTYHEYTCEGRGDSKIVIGSTVPLKDFRYVRFDYRDIGHIGGDELERHVVTLYNVGELRPEKPLLIKNFTVAGPTDAKGITFIDPAGERRNYRILEDSIGDSGHPYIMVRVD